MKLFCTFLMFVITTVLAYGQSGLKKYYRNEKGVIYSEKGFDSLESEANKFSHPIAIKEKIIKGDSAIMSFEILPFLDIPVIGKYEGKALPDFELKDIKGNTVNSGNLRGKIVYINFWSVTCSPCIAEMPDLNKLVKKYRNNKQVVFIAIAPESKETIAKFLKSHTFNYTIISGAAYFKQLGIEGYPVNFFVDKKGTIKTINHGMPINMITRKSTAYEDYGKIIDDLQANIN